MLVYSAICSLDGYIEDPDGSFDWARPSDEVHAFVNDQERSVSTYLYGRRMYETMVAWETIEDPARVKAAPTKTPVRRLDEARAARRLELSWQDTEAHGGAA